MNRKRFFLVSMFSLALIGNSCDQFNRLSATKIKDVVERPREYENKEITIYGTVTESASIIIAKYFSRTIRGQ